MTRIFFHAALAVPLAFCVACAGPQKHVPATAGPVPVSTAVVPYEVAALDEAVVVAGDGQRETLQVALEGDLLLGESSRRVKGMSSGEFEALVRKSFPHARSVEIREFRTNRVTVLGEVFHQIHTDLGDGPMRVMDAVASANGFTPLANRRRVKLVRQNAGRIAVYELDLREMMKGRGLGQNLLLKPGDVITVPRNFL